jgi:hypothetical protein
MLIEEEEDIEIPIGGNPEENGIPNLPANIVPNKYINQIIIKYSK